MPIRRSVAATQETASKKAPVQEQEKIDLDASSDSASTGEEQENETPAAAPAEAEKSKSKDEEEEKDKEKKKSDLETAPEEKKEEKDASKEKEKEKEKKVKKTIPSWATLSASQLARAHKQSHLAPSSRPKMDAILVEAIKACAQRSGASVVAIRKYIINKYPSLDLERRGYLLKQALKRELERGAIKQVKGKGASGSFVMAGGAGKPTQKTKGSKKKKGAAVQEHPEKLENALPLVFTRLCEPKEASYGLIKKYVAQHYPKLSVDSRPQVLKNAIQRAVDKGQLEQITGKGATGTFQLKRSGDKYLLSGGPYEDAIVCAISAMNEPKTCSTTLLKKYVLEKYPSSNSRFQVHLLKRVLRKCEKNGWMEQISGKGFSGTFMLCFPYYPSPDVLFPEKQSEESEDESEEEDEEEEEESEESEEESESEDDEPPKKKTSKRPKRPAPKARARATPQKRKSVGAKAKPSKEVPPKKEKAKSTPKKEEVAAPKAAPPPKKSKPTPVSVKKENEAPKKPAAPAKGAQSPAKGAQSPAKGAQSPAKGAQSPAKGKKTTRRARAI